MRKIGGTQHPGLSSWRSSRYTLISSFIAGTSMAAVLLGDLSDLGKVILVLLIVVSSSFAIIHFTLKMVETGIQSFKEPPILASVVLFFPVLYMLVVSGFIVVNELAGMFTSLSPGYGGRGAIGMAVLLVFGFLWCKEIFGRLGSDMAVLKESQDKGHKGVIIFWWVATVPVVLLMVSFAWGFIRYFV